MSEKTFAKDETASRWTMHVGDNLVGVLDYRDDGQAVAMTRSFTVPTFRGNGYAADLVEHAVSELEAQGDRSIIPVCWYVGQWFDERPDRAAILKA